METISEGAYQTIQKVQPTLLPVITQLLEKGQTPKQIADFVGKRAGPFLAGIVEMAADYMRDHRRGLTPRAVDGVLVCPSCELELSKDNICPKCFGQYHPATNA